MTNFYQIKPDVSGRQIVEGTLEAKHIKASTITANKFSGAVEEEYWSFGDLIDISWSYSTYYTAMEWTFPKTELSLYKGRHVNWTAEGYHSTQSSSAQNADFYFSLEVETPSAQTTTGIGLATHVSYPEQYYQLVYFDGHIAMNRIGSGGSIGTVSGNYRTYKKIYYDSSTLGSELVTNGTFDSGTANWTVGLGGHSFGYGNYTVATSSTGNKGFTYQEITTVVGEKYKLTGNIVNGVADGEIRITNEPSGVGIDWLNDSSVQIATTGVKTNNFTADIEFTATSTKTYILLIASGTSSGQSVGFDNISLKQYLRRTYVQLSTFGGQLVSQSGTTQLYYHPYSGASAGTYVQLDLKTYSIRTRTYINRVALEQDCYVGWFEDDLKMRLRVRNTGVFGKALQLQNLKIYMQSRIVE